MRGVWRAKLRLAAVRQPLTIALVGNWAPGPTAE